MDCISETNPFDLTGIKMRLNILEISDSIQVFEGRKMLTVNTNIQEPGFRSTCKSAAAAPVFIASFAVFGYS